MGRRVRAGIAAGFWAIVAVAGCAGSGGTTAPARSVDSAPVAVAQTAPPTAAPSIAATLTGQVAAACSGMPVPEAEPYGGAVHPLYVVTGGDVQRADQQRYSFASGALRTAWLREAWTSPLQLVVCVGGQDRVKIESCGKYMSNFGKSYEVIRYRLVRTVTIVDAATGTTRGIDRVPGSDPDRCTATVQSFDLVGGEPNVYEFALGIAGL